MTSEVSTTMRLNVISYLMSIEEIPFHVLEWLVKDSKKQVKPIGGRGFSQDQLSLRYGSHEMPIGDDQLPICHRARCFKRI